PGSRRGLTTPPAARRKRTAEGGGPGRCASARGRNSSRDLRRLRLGDCEAQHDTHMYKIGAVLDAETLALCGLDEPGLDLLKLPELLTGKSLSPTKPTE